MEADRRRVAASAALGGLTVAGGVAVLVGWALELPQLKSALPGVVTMKANTAAGFILSGLSLVLVDRGPGSRLAIRLLAGATTLLGVLTLSEYALQVDLGIDQLLFREEPGAVGTASPNRMAPTTAVSFALVGISRWLACSGRGLRASQSLALGVGLLGFLSTAGYAFGATDLIGIGRYTQMAVHTAALFLVVGLALLLLHPAEGLLAIFRKNTAGAWFLRRLMPLLVLVPLFTGWLAVRGLQHGLWNPPFAIGIVVVVLLVAIAALSYWTAQRLNASEERLRAQQAQLALASRLAAMGTLVAGVAHEINNPLAADVAGVGLALEGARDLRERLRDGSPIGIEAQLRQLDGIIEALEDARHGSQRVAGVVKDLAAFANPDPKRTRILLADVAATAIRWMPVALGQMVDIRVEDRGAPPVLASAGQIEQVVVNLLTNAAKATPPGKRGDIVIWIGPSGNGKARLEVADQGVGIDPGIRDRIFEPFFTTRRVGLGKGAGLGLAICHAIVTDHGGALTLESEVGKGSTFRVELPAAPAEA